MTDLTPDPLTGRTDPLCADLSAEQLTSEQPDDLDAFEAWIRRMFERGRDEGWGQ